MLTVLVLTLGLPGWSADLLLATVGSRAMLAGLSMLLVTPSALAASPDAATCLPSA